MLKIYQQTIKNPITFKGVKFHSGRKSKIRLIPSDSKGIVFKRTDLKKQYNYRKL